MYIVVMQNNEVVVDVSAVIPRERHPKVFNAWHALADGAAMVLVNDHDPVPLYYQSAAGAGEPLVLDVRPIFAQGGSPCTNIDNAVASLLPGQSFVLLVPFEPAPLFGKLGAKGLTGKSELQPDGSYRIEFTPGGPVLSGGAAVGTGGCGGH